ncbi:hypothetical protein [Streptomyces qinglanensis]|uniref:hypothetical protein n=1 Tax=Streptomyces qinglanensis TaxID=943816 RepID=UPI003D737430
MTATHVNGIAVVEDEPAQSGISRPGKNVVFEQVRHLLLEDGSEVYGCAHCTYTSDNKLSIRPHLKVHKTGSASPKPEKRRAVAAPPNRRDAPRPQRRTSESAEPTAGGLASLTVGQLVEGAQLVEQMRSQRDAARREAAEWKKRAAPTEQLRKQRDAARAEAEAVRRQVADWQERAADYRERWRGMKDRAETAEKRIDRLRDLLS